MFCRDKYVMPVYCYSHSVSLLFFGGCAALMIKWGISLNQNYCFTAGSNELWKSLYWFVSGQTLLSVRAAVLAECVIKYSADLPIFVPTSGLRHF